MRVFKIFVVRTATKEMGKWNLFWRSDSSWCCVFWKLLLYRCRNRQICFWSWRGNL